jgi:hypothetical protein
MRAGNLFRLPQNKLVLELGALGPLPAYPVSLVAELASSEPLILVDPAPITVSAKAPALQLPPRAIKGLAPVQRAPRATSTSWCEGRRFTHARISTYNSFKPNPLRGSA